MKKPNPCVWTWGPGPEGKRCKTCARLMWHNSAGRRYYKCALRLDTHGAATDHRINWPACEKYVEGGATNLEGSGSGRRVNWPACGKYESA